MDKKFIILVGKSASGKTTLADYLIENENYKKFRTATTRPIRENETENDYEFISKDEFLDRLNNNGFVEYNTYNVRFDDKDQTWYYGTPKRKIENDDKYVVVLTLYGAMYFAKYYGIENCEIIYLDCSIDERRKRAMKRGSFQEIEWERRLLEDSYDFPIMGVRTICNKTIETDNKSVEQIAKEIINGQV